LKFDRVKAINKIRRLEQWFMNGIKTVVKNCIN
jgi:hypothetical protein